MRMQVHSGWRIWHFCELQHRSAAAALIRPLAWEPPYAVGTALEETKKKKNYFCFCCLCFCCQIQTIVFHDQCQGAYHLCFLLGVTGHTFKSLVHLELIFVYGVWYIQFSQYDLLKRLFIPHRMFLALSLEINWLNMQYLFWGSLFCFVDLFVFFNANTTYCFDYSNLVI